MSFRVKQRVLRRSGTTKPSEKKHDSIVEGNLTQLVLPPDWSGHLVPNRRLGVGSYGNVYDMSISCNGMHVAVKAMHFILGQAEASVLEYTRSERVLEVFAHGTSYTSDWDQGDYYIMTEVANAGDLADLIEKRFYSMTFQQKMELFAEVLEGLLFLHGKGIVHNDIKPNNVLLFYKKGRVQAKLGDLGLACLMGEETEIVPSCERLQGGSEGIGAAAFQSPEHNKTKSIDFPKDMWAVGLILYELIFGPGVGKGRYPCYITALMETWDPKDINGRGWILDEEGLIFDVSSLNSTHVPSQMQKPIQDILRGLMILDPAKRLTAEQALDLIKGMLENSLPSGMVQTLPSCWKERVVSPDAELIMTSENGYQILEEQVAKAGANARGIALLNSIVQKNVESVRLLLADDISQAVMTHGVTSALVRAAEHGGEWIESMLPALTAHMTSSAVDSSLLEIVKMWKKKPFLGETVRWLLGVTPVSDQAKEEAMKFVARKNLEAAACALAESIDENQLLPFVQRLSLQGHAGILQCILLKLTSSNDSSLNKKLQDALNTAAFAASKRGRLSQNNVTLYMEEYKNGLKDNFITFEILLDHGISDDMASEILLWFACKTDLKEFDPRFIVKSIDRLAGNIDILTKAWRGATERANTAMSKQLIDAGARSDEDVSSKPVVCKAATPYGPLRMPHRGPRGPPPSGRPTFIGGSRPRPAGPPLPSTMKE